MEGVVRQRCLETVAGEPRLEICDDSNTRQHWRIVKTGNDGKYFRICQRILDNDGNTSLASHDCLTALFEIDKSMNFTNIRSLKLRPQKVEGDASQQWQMDSIPNQFASVQDPKACITMKVMFSGGKRNSLIVLKECNNKSSGSNYYQIFYPKPVLLDKNKEQLCDYDGSGPKLLTNQIGNYLAI